MIRPLGCVMVRTVLIAASALSLAACASAPRPASVGGTGRPYTINGVTYTPRADPRYNEVGLASWYGREHQGKPTATGERFDRARITAAHKTLPLPSMVEVTNLENGRRIQVRVNDRGPFVKGRIIDLSQAAARELGFEAKGLAKVRVRYIGPGPARTAELDARFTP